MWETDQHREMIGRYECDRLIVRKALLDGVDPGPVVLVRPRLGDTHRHGRSVTLVGFTDGRQIVYKPRSTCAEGYFAELVGWLNGEVPDLGLRASATVSRDGYGWAEYVPAAEAGDLAAAHRFFHRHGALLALLHTVRATDAHYENVIAAGDQPVLIDAETLFQPWMGAPQPDPAAQALAESVRRTALLPTLAPAANGLVDIGGISGGPAANRLRLGGADVDPADFTAAVQEGFRCAYHAIMRRRPEFTMLLKAAADLEIRIVARPTQFYAQLLAQVGDQPDPAAFLASRLVSPLADYEIQALLCGDIPYFTGRPGSLDIWTPNGQRIEGLLTTSGLDSALATVAAMDDADRQDQAWVLSASLACGSVGSSAASHPASGDASIAEPDRLLAAACGIADLLVARSIAGDGRTNWFGLEPVDEAHWMVLPAGAGLGSGYSGIALFLAQLARLTGIVRYADVAAEAMSALPPLCRALSGQTDWVQAVGCGGFDGFGGIAYALARVSGLLGDTGLVHAAAEAVQLARVAATASAPAADIVSGLAGCLVAMTAVRQELALPQAAELAVICATRLTALAPAGTGTATGGISRGAAGIAWALRTLPASDDFAFALDDPSWCAGAAGLAAAQLQLHQDPQAGAARRVALALARRPVLADLSLCHGELGIAEALTVLAAADPSVTRDHRRRAGQILGVVEEHGPRCGTPRGVPTPGLLHGLAGIGYGLLRLGFAEQVPSVLLLEPTPSN